MQDLPIVDDAFYMRLIESIKDYAVFTTDTLGNILTWNTGAENIMLFKPTEIVGRSGHILFTPEDIANKAPEREMETSLREGRAVNERFHVKKNRTRFWGSGLVFPIYGKENEHIGFTKVMRNLSEEEEAQKNIKEERALAAALVNTYQEPLAILNADMQVVNVTPAFIKYFGLDSGTVAGHHFFKVIEEGINLNQLKEQLESALSAREYYKDFEIQHMHSERGERSLTVKLRRFYQPPNVLFSLEFVDRTDDQAILEEKDVFISVASHEIRTPLSIIKAYGQVLERESRDAKPIVVKAVKKINEQISFMKSLIDVLLDTSKIASGKMRLDREVFNLSDLVKEQIDAFGLTVPSHKIHLEKETDCIVFADKVRMMTVIGNLLSNAVKYSPEAKEVIVRIHASDHHVEVSVEDFGIGIPKSELSRLFQRFARTENVIKKRISGTGLGLHLASEIIKLEGGSITVTSKEGRGSIFKFTIPLYDNLSSIDS